MTDEANTLVKYFLSLSKGVFAFTFPAKLADQLILL